MGQPVEGSLGSTSPLPGRSAPRPLEAATPLPSMEMKLCPMAMGSAGSGAPDQFDAMTSAPWSWRTASVHTPCWRNEAVMPSAWRSTEKWMASVGEAAWPSLASKPKERASSSWAQGRPGTSSHRPWRPMAAAGRKILGAGAARAVPGASGWRMSPEVTVLGPLIRPMEGPRQVIEKYMSSRDGVSNTGPLWASERPWRAASATAQAEVRGRRRKTWGMARKGRRGIRGGIGGGPWGPSDAFT